MTHRLYNSIETSFDLFLYNSTTHIKTQDDRIINTFSLYRHNNPSAIAIIRLVNTFESDWKSPPRAPFGSIQCCTSCNKDEISFFLECIASYILSKGGRNLIIKHYAPCYLLGNTDLIAQYYNAYALVPIDIQLNHHIPVDAKLFPEMIKPAEKRRLKKCISAEFLSGMDNHLTPESIYAFLVDCRLKKQYELSLSKDQLSELLKTFPTEALVFTVKDQNRIIALSVVIRVNRKIIYNFLTDSLPEYHIYSPAVLLTQSIYHYCQQEKIAILDLGTSVDHCGREKAGLVRFKENIGGVQGKKTTYCLDLENYIPKQLPSL